MSKFVKICSAVQTDGLRDSVGAPHRSRHTERIKILISDFPLSFRALFLPKFASGLRSFTFANLMLGCLYFSVPREERFGKHWWNIKQATFGFRRHLQVRNRTFIDTGYVRTRTYSKPWGMTLSINRHAFDDPTRRKRAIPNYLCVTT
jgi:hypothetical protein